MRQYVEERSSRGLYSIGIDASNLRGGGGVTHLVELLRSACPDKNKFSRIILWGGTETLSQVQNRPWLVKRSPTALNKGLWLRTYWQSFCLSRAAYDEGCDVLFVPGGSYAGSFEPVVAMSQNLLPFEMRELRRYGWSLMTLKLFLLRLTHSRSFRRANGVIFLTNYAQRAVLDVIGGANGSTAIIAHGLSPRFDSSPKAQKKITEYDELTPYRVIYVSMIDHYKHQWNVVEAVSILRERGFPVVLDLVGPANPSALQRLKCSLDNADPGGRWVNYHGEVAFDELHHKYLQADLGLFASSCENLPNILLETMASGLPIACSSRGPMPEVLEGSAIYFDPEQPESIAAALITLVKSPSLRHELVQQSYSRSKQYSWEQCAARTFSFLNECAEKFERN
jgi:glycosyltransferase involved in cell wall biosynthesis